MLKNIKLIYFIKNLFLYVLEKQKLKLVKHNKNLQKNIDINIINYKYFTGKYIIYESSKIEKEYYGYADALTYEGEYKNGERNGKGKEYYDNGNLIFEGEYLNGKRNGKGKEYFNCKLIFEGEYLNNKRLVGIGYDINGGDIMYTLSNNINGNGKEYGYDGSLVFEGEYLNGKRNGKGKEYNYFGKLVFEGEYKNDIKWNGKGYDSNKNIL